MNTAAEPYRLTEQQVQDFERDGYLVVEDLLSDDDLQPVIDEITGEVDRLAMGLVAEGELTSTYQDLGFEHRLAHISAETPRVAAAIWNGSLAGPAFLDLIRDPRLLDVAEQFCGPEIIASSVYRLRPKIPNYSYGAVPWHQDSGYTEPFCDRSFMLTVWLPLVDADEANGCMWVKPGLHHGEVFLHKPGKSYLVIPHRAMPPAESVCVPVRKGSVLLLSNLTPHASFTNSTDIVRWSMDLRYQSAALPTNAAITRLDGEAVVGNGAPPACYPPEADFLVRSRLRPGEVVTDASVFRRIRTEHLSQPVTSRW